MPTLTLEQKGAVALITLRREARANALSREMLDDFLALRAEVESHAAFRVIVVTGSGDRAFSAGADLKERASMSDDEVRAMLRQYREALDWLDHSPLPVVAAINGAALGGGLELALLCDLRIASPNATLGLPETSLGIIPGAGGTQRLPRIIGAARAKEMILLGQRWPAEKALEFGLVHRLSQSRESLLDETLAWIEPITEGAPIAQALALEAIDGALDLPLEQGLQHELALYERCLDTEDRREALAAFQAKRLPVFKGR